MITCVVILLVTLKSTNVLCGCSLFSFLPVGWTGWCKVQQLTICTSCWCVWDGWWTCMALMVASASASMTRFAILWHLLTDTEQPLHCTSPTFWLAPCLPSVSKCMTCLRWGYFERALNFYPQTYHILCFRKLWKDLFHIMFSSDGYRTKICI